MLDDASGAHATTRRRKDGRNALLWAETFDSAASIDIKHHQTSTTTTELDILALVCFFLRATIISRTTSTQHSPRTNATMQLITPPNARDLLPPILACLPTAFFSPQPPPALLPLLSPILRQRVRLLSASSSSASPNTTWLNLLTWSPERGTALVEVVSRLQLEPHPVSGELELFPDDGDDRVWYCRLDAETLQARCEVREHGLAVVWVWCVNDTGGGALDGAGGAPENAWRVAEVLPLEDEEGRFDEEQRAGWYDSMRAAEDESERVSALLEEGVKATAPATQTHPRMQVPEVQVEDDDDYWAAYDQTPGRTPAHRSPAPRSIASPNATRKQSTAEEDYYARYGEEVQPAMDGHDPDEEAASAEFESSFGGAATQPSYDGGADWQDTHHAGVAASEYASFMSGGADDDKRYSRDRSDTNATAVPDAQQQQSRIHSPTPRSRSSSPSVAALEASASEASAAEIAVKRHISMEIKTLFRLAQGVGLEKGEFERVVRTELDCLSLTEL